MKILLSFVEHTYVAQTAVKLVKIILYCDNELLLMECEYLQIKTPNYHEITIQASYTIFATTLYLYTHLILEERAVSLFAYY